MILIRSDKLYRDLTLALLERCADKAGIERFRVHQYDQLEREVVNAHRPEKRSVNLPGILKGRELLLRAKKEPLLDDIADALVCGIKQG